MISGRSICLNPTPKIKNLPKPQAKLEASALKCGAVLFTVLGRLGGLSGRPLFPYVILSLNLGERIFQP